MQVPAITGRMGAYLCRTVGHAQQNYQDTCARTTEVALRPYAQPFRITGAGTLSWLQAALTTSQHHWHISADRGEEGTATIRFFANSVQPQHCSPDPPPSIETWESGHKGGRRKAFSLISSFSTADASSRRTMLALLGSWGPAMSKPGHQTENGQIPLPLSYVAPVKRAKLNIARFVEFQEPFHHSKPRWIWSNESFPM